MPDVGVMAIPSAIAAHTKRSCSQIWYGRTSVWVRHFMETTIRTTTGKGSDVAYKCLRLSSQRIGIVLSELVSEVEY